MRLRPSGMRELVIVVFGVGGLALLPWTVWLSSTLTPEHTTHRWDVAWAGFDIGLALAFLGTAAAAWRRSPWVGVLAGITGTMLVTDAWFDIVLESSGDELRTAIVEAVVAELPAAVVCFWIAVRTERFLARVVAAASHLAPAGESPPESDLVRVLEVATDGEPAREARHPDPSA